MNTPNKSHFANIYPYNGLAVARLGDQVVASSRAVMELVEEYKGRVLDPVYYFPIKDCKTDLFQVSETHTHCSIKGEASYYDITINGVIHKDAVWYYSEPMDQVALIRGYVAFMKPLLSVAL